MRAVFPLRQIGLAWRPVLIAAFAGVLNGSALASPLAGASASLREGVSRSPVAWVRIAGEDLYSEQTVRYHFLVESRGAIKKGRNTGHSTLFSGEIEANGVAAGAGWRVCPEPSSTLFRDPASVYRWRGGPPPARKQSLYYAGLTQIGGLWMTPDSSAPGLYLGGHGARWFAGWLPQASSAAIFLRPRLPWASLLIDAAREDESWQGFARLRRDSSHGLDGSPPQWEFSLEAERRKDWDSGAEDRIYAGKSGAASVFLGYRSQLELQAYGSDRYDDSMRGGSLDYLPGRKDHWQWGLRAAASRWQSRYAEGNWSGDAFSGGAVLRWRAQGLALQLDIQVQSAAGARGSLRLEYGNDEFRFAASAALAEAKGAHDGFLVTRGWSEAQSSIDLHARALLVFRLEAALPGLQLEMRSVESADQRTLYASAATELRF